MLKIVKKTAYFAFVVLVLGFIFYFPAIMDIEWHEQGHIRVCEMQDVSCNKWVGYLTMSGETSFSLSGLSEHEKEVFYNRQAMVEAIGYNNEGLMFAVTFTNILLFFIVCKVYQINKKLKVIKK